MVRIIDRIRVIFRKIFHRWQRFLTKSHLRARGVVFQDDLYVRGPLYIERAEGSEIILGSRVAVNSDRWANLIISSPGSMLATIEKDARIEIGDGVGMSSIRMVAARGICVGEHTIFGADCLVVDTDFHNPLPDGTWGSDNLLSAKKVVIGKSCFIGARVTILKGVRIGDRAVVASNSLVTRDVPAGYLAIGNPAIVKPLPPHWLPE